MSIGHFFANIWHGIKDLFDDLPGHLKDAIHIGVVVTENLKKWIDSPVADVLTTIIPGDLDDTIKNALREKLPEILIKLKLAENCAELTDPNEIVICAIQTLSAIEGDFKGAFLHDLSILIAQVASDGKLSWSDGAAILEWYYQHKYKG